MDDVRVKMGRIKQTFVNKQERRLLQGSVFQEKKMIETNGINDRIEPEQQDGIQDFYISDKKEQFTEVNEGQAIKSIKEQKLQVEILHKQIHQKSQTPEQEIRNQQDNGPFGPFSQSKSKTQFQLNNVNEGINYHIEISPILSDINQLKQNNHLQSKQKHQFKKKKSANILTEESNHQLQSEKTDQAQLQKQILALAKNIRQKVKKKHKTKNNPQNQRELSSMTPAKNDETKDSQIKAKKLYQKRQSLFEKYSYPRSVGIDLIELQRQEARYKVGKYTISRVYNEQVAQQSTQNLEAITQKNQPLTHTNNCSQSRTKQKARKHVQLPRLKLNFDKTHHRYQMTEFRKNILKEKKERQMAKSLMIKEKEQTLQRRRQIYNNSRYHPIGVRLSSLKTSRADEKKIKKDLVMTDRVGNSQKQVISQFTINPSKQTTYAANNNNQTKFMQGTTTLSKLLQAEMMETKNASQSEVKSSLTFNFSFGDPTRSQIQPKTQSQIINEVSELTKQLQNDSDIKDKIQNNRYDDYLNEKKSHTFQSKKWVTIDKQMTENKHIEEQALLHNQEQSEQDPYQQTYRNISLEYSYA